MWQWSPGGPLSLLATRSNPRSHRYTLPNVQHAGSPIGLPGSAARLLQGWQQTPELPVLSQHCQVPAHRGRSRESRGHFQMQHSALNVQSGCKKGSLRETEQTGRLPAVNTQQHHSPWTWQIKVHAPEQPLTKEQVRGSPDQQVEVFLFRNSNEVQK